MPIAPWSRLASARINAIFQEITQVIDRRLPRIWSARVPSVEMEDGDILARIPVDQIVMADIIEFDQQAVIRADTSIRLQTEEIVKFKHGKMLSEEKIMLLRRIENGQASAREITTFDSYVAQSLMSLRLGLDDRKELMLAQMVEDTSSYDKYGIKWTNVSWGMPAGLKWTPNPTWDVANLATMKPISDLLTAKQYALETYGEVYNRVTMPLAVLKNVINSTEFKDQLKLTVPLAAIANITVFNQNVDQMALVLGNMLGMTVEVYEARTKDEAADGTLTTVRFNNAKKVVLSDSNDDGNAQSWRFGNGVLAETIPGIIPNLIGGESVGGDLSSGPIAFTTAANPVGNPPGLTMWAAQRGFPVKNRETCTSVGSVLA